MNEEEAKPYTDQPVGTPLGAKWLSVIVLMYMDHYYKLVTMSERE